MDNPAKVVETAVKSGSTLKFVLQVLVAIYIIFLVLDLISAYLLPGAQAFVLSPFTSIKAKLAAKVGA